MTSLGGKTVLVTRANSQASSMINLIKDQGGVALHTPLISFQLHESAENQRLIKQLHDYSWVFLTSSNGVKFFFELLRREKQSIPDHIKFAIVGTKTKAALEGFGYGASFIPTRFNADTMGKEFLETYPEPGNILYIRGNRSRDVLPKLFQDKHVFFHSMTAYDTLLMEEHKSKIVKKVTDHQLDAITFTSPSTVQALVALSGDHREVFRIPCFCIGPTTADQAKLEGFHYVFHPGQYTVEDLVTQMIDYFRKERDRF
ncbi:uroporphyrinogen-III synthase [Halobacillus fulvus]|nr:uroporphyrinogen-III synthase [Halobacillus fulvus]